MTKRAALKTQFPAQQAFELSNGETLVLMAVSGVVVDERNWVDTGSSVSMNTIANYDGTLNRTEVSVKQNAAHHRMVQVKTDSGKYLSVNMDEESFFCPPGERVELLLAQRVPRYHQETGLGSHLRMEGEGDPVAYIRNRARNTDCARALKLVEALSLTHPERWRQVAVGLSTLVAAAVWLAPLPWHIALPGSMAALLALFVSLVWPRRTNLHLEVAEAVEQAKALLGTGPVEFDLS